MRINIVVEATEEELPQANLLFDFFSDTIEAVVDTAVKTIEEDYPSLRSAIKGATLGDGSVIIITDTIANCLNITQQ
jgi:hypothetical protein